MDAYKILTPDQWHDFIDNGRFDGAPIDHEDGYIHLSTAVQVRETVRRYFAEEPRIYLAIFPQSALEGHLKWEPSRGGDLFPHYYAPLQKVHMSRFLILSHGDEGAHIWPDNFKG